MHRFCRDLFKISPSALDRGRGRGGGMFRGGRGAPRYDNFRARIQNTSRPPSMHVDDFVAMESGRGRARGRGAQSPVNDRSVARPSMRKVNARLQYGNILLTSSNTRPER